MVFDVIELGAEPDAVPRARSFVATRLGDAGTEPGLVADAELAVSELVTNALLYAGPPVLVRVNSADEHIRIEVEDHSHHAPMRGVATADSMTGRGLTLVEALAQHWGVEHTPGGKVVWCELGPDGDQAVPADDVDIDAILAAWSDDDDSPEPRVTLTLGDVPTDLLLAAKAHVDNLVREFALEAGSGTAVPKHLARMIEAVVNRFADARHSIKRQAVAAAKAGAPRTTLVLALPLSSADAGEEYLAALDEADAYARAARLLTLATPPQHRVFRRWYVEALVRQLRDVSAGREPTPAPTFEERLLEEVDELAGARRRTDRSARLQTVTAALAQALTEQDVARVVVTEGVAALGAAGGALLLPAGDHRITVPGVVGYGDDLLGMLRSERADAALPAATALRTGEPVWMESPEELAAHFPELGPLEPTTRAMCAVPVICGERVLGALRFSFEHPRLFDDDEREFVVALAAQTSQALERSQLYAAEREARDAAEAAAARLAHLQQVTGGLATARTEEQVAAVMVDSAAEAVGAELATLFLVEDDRLVLKRSRGLPAGSAQRWATSSLDAALPSAEAVREHRTLYIRGTGDLERRYPLLAGQAAIDRAHVWLPLGTAAGTIGVVSLSFPHDRHLEPADLGLLRSLADTCAQGLERARADAHARTANQKLEFLAEASEALAASLDMRDTLATIARLAVPRLADWAAVHMVDGDTYRPLVVTHTDPERVDLAGSLQQRYPPDPDATSGVAAVIRTGRSELHRDIPDALLGDLAVDDDHLALMQQLGLRSAVIAPLRVGEEVLGAISFFSAESGRHYGEDDLGLAEDLARRAALAIANAERFRRRGASDEGG